MKKMLKNILALFKRVLIEITYLILSLIVCSVFFAILILVIYGLIKL